jgi:hypothetical protein
MDPREAASSTQAAVNDYGRTVPAECFSPAGMAAPPAPAPEAAAGAPTLPGASALGDAESRRFAVEGLIGVGASGEVFEVRDRDLERVVAVKVLRAELAGVADEVAGFVAEARLSASLSHPNVLPVHDLDRAGDGRPYFSMGRIRGRTLGAALAESTLERRHAAIAEPNAVVSIAIDLCNAIAYAHHQGVVHQDIKPDNVMLGDFGEVLLLDWGGAGRVDASGKVVGRLYGTPLYMSPEQARRERADRRSDVHCIGATLFHALTLRPPCWDVDADRFWNRRRAGEIDQPTPDERRAVPAELLAIALKAMEPDPEARYQSPEAMRRDLERYQAGLAVSAHRESVWRRFRRWYRANHTLFWTGAAAAAALVLAAMLAIADWNKERTAWRELTRYAQPIDAASLSRDWHVRIHHGWDATLPFADAALAPWVRPEQGAMIVGALDDVICDVSVRDGIAGDVALEWDCRPLMSAGNINCFIAGEDRYRSFTFHVGYGGGLDRCMFSHDDQTLFSIPMPETIVMGRTYHMRLERDARRLRLAIDGHTLIDWLDVEDLCGPSLRFGFDGIVGQRLWIGNIHVYQRTIPQRVSPLALGDELLRLKLSDRDSDAAVVSEAERRYREVADSMPGSDEAVRAEFRLATCARRRNDPTAAAQFRRFAAEHPDHELAPFAWSQLSALASASGDAARLEDARTALERFHGHEVQRVEVHRLAEEVLRRFGKPPREQAETKVAEAIAQLQRDAERYGFEVAADDAVGKVSARLFEVHLYDAVVANGYISSSDRAIALRYLGRFDEALALGGDARSRLLADQGRLEEALVDPEAKFDERMRALYRLGRLDEMRRLAPAHQMVDNLDLDDGRAAEYLARHGGADDAFGPTFGFTPRAYAMFLVGRYEELLAYYRSTDVRACSLAMLGRFDEADQESRKAPFPIGVPFAAVELARRGDWGRALALVEHAPIDGFYEHQSFQWEWRAALLAAAHDDPERARATFASLRARSLHRDGDTKWHDATFALGLESESEYRAQPQRLCIDFRALLVRAAARELAGDHGGAAALDLEALRLPHWQRSLELEELYWLRWRIVAAGLTPPEPLAPTIDMAYR